MWTQYFKNAMGQDFDFLCIPEARLICYCSKYIAGSNDVTLSLWVHQYRSSSNPQWTRRKKNWKNKKKRNCAISIMDRRLWCVHTHMHTDRILYSVPRNKTHFSSGVERQSVKGAAPMQILLT